MQYEYSNTYSDSGGMRSAYYGTEFTPVFSVMSEDSSTTSQATESTTDQSQPGRVNGGRGQIFNVDTL